MLTMPLLTGIVLIVVSGIVGLIFGYLIAAWFLVDDVRRVMEERDNYERLYLQSRDLKSNQEE